MNTIDVLHRLERFYGPLPQPPDDPFALYVWEVLGIHTTASRRDAAMGALRRIPALTPDSMGRAPRAKLEGANLTNVRGSADMRNQPMGLIRLVLVGARLQGARLIEAQLARADLSYADLRKADLSGADLTRAKLVGADLRGAILTHATFEGAEIHDAIFTGAVGVESTRGLEAAEGRDSASFDR